MPTSATHTFAPDEIVPAYTGPNIQIVELPFKIPNSTTIVKGTVVGELTASPGTMKAYATGASDGSETAKGIMKYTVTSDASGNIYFGTSATGQFGESFRNCPVFVSGNFKTTELTGLDAAGVADLAGRYWHGVLSDGVVAF